MTNHEIYAEKNQKEALQRSCTLEKAIENLKLIKEQNSNDYYEAVCGTIAMLYDLPYNSINNAVNGEKYWIV